MIKEKRNMSITITLAGYEFSVFTSTSSLENKGGVYAILDLRSDDRYYPIDVGESAEVKDRVENHDRKPCWNRNIRGSIRYGVHYTPGKSAEARRKIEAEIRDKYDPPCGKV
jgi:hypothetical protein